MNTEPLTIPEGMTISELAGELEIVVRWSHAVTKVFFAALLVFFGFEAARFFQFKTSTRMTRDSITSMLNEPFPFNLFEPIVFCFALWLSYFLAAHILNRTRITATQTRLVVRHGPLPWPGNRDLEVASIRQILAQMRLPGSRHDGGPINHEILVVTHDQGTVKLVSGLKASREQASFIAMTLKKYLDITNVGVHTKNGTNRAATFVPATQQANLAPIRARTTVKTLQHAGRGAALQITRTWFDKSKISMAAFGLLWTTFTSWFAWSFITSFHKTTSLADIELQATDYGLALFPVIGLFILYPAIAGLLNRTKLVISGGWISVRHGPLPWRGNHNLLLEEIKALNVPKSLVAQLRRTMFGGHRLEVRALLIDGRNLRLIGNFDTYEEALAVKREIEPYVKPQLTL
jgi:hypothetical protein